MIDSSLDTAIGNSIKQHRVEDGLTIKELASVAGISTAHLSRIENGERSPSISALASLAHQLGVPIRRLLPTTPDDTEAVVREDSLVVRSGDLTVRPLTNRTDSHLNPVLVTVPKGREWHPAVTHPGEEWIYVVSGILLVAHGEAVDELRSGDSIHFSATEPHRLEAVIEANAIVISHATAKGTRT